MTKYKHTWGCRGKCGNTCVKKKNARNRKYYHKKVAQGFKGGRSPKAYLKTIARSALWRINNPKRYRDLDREYKRKRRRKFAFLGSDLSNWLGLVDNFERKLLANHSVAQDT